MISNLGELKSQLRDELHLYHLDAQLPLFVRRAESHMNRKLRTPAMVTVQNGTLAGQTLALPERFVDKLRFSLDGDELRYAHPSAMPQTAAGRPRRYTVTQQIEFDCPPAAAYPYVLTFYRGFRLASDMDTNDLLTNYPMAYLYAAQMFAHLHVQDEPRAATMSQLLAAELREINRAERRRAGMDGATLTTELAAGHYDFERG